MNDFYNPTLGSKIWIFLIHIQQLCSEVIKDDQLILNNISKKQNIIAIIPPLLFKSCDWVIIKLSEVGHGSALEIGQGCGCADGPPTPTPDSSRGRAPGSLQPHLPFFFLLSSLSSQLLSKQSRLGFLSWTRQRCPLRWLLHVKLLKMWHTGRIWNKPIVAETKGEIVTVGGIGVDMGHCQWLTDGLKVGPKVGARSEVWADYSCKTIHRFHNWFSQSRRRQLS